MADDDTQSKIKAAVKTAAAELDADGNIDNHERASRLIKKWKRKKRRKTKKRRKRKTRKTNKKRRRKSNI